MKNLKIISLLIILLIPISLFSQNEEPAFKAVDFTVHLKNMHLWRGLQISNEVTATSDIYLQDKSKTFRLGVWGGAGINGNYKEFNNYFIASKYGFTFAVWDIYNFSPDATWNNREIFNYSARETGRFIDVSLGYRFKDIPLGLSWATVIFGRDRGATNEKNLYSTYVYMDYPVCAQNGYDVKLGVGGAFALSPEKGTNAHFYGKNPGVVNINVRVSKVLMLGTYKLPISAMAMWNPEQNFANLELAINLF